MKKRIAFVFGILFAGLALPGFAAENYFIDRNGDPLPYAALCSTHAYNIGQSENPPAGDTRDEMNRVVALKSELITREMKKQYDYLDATVKRFQIQMQKAVLVAQKEAETKADESNSSTITTNSPYENCRALSIDETVKCVRGNLTLYNNNTKVDAAMRTQILKDAQLVDSLVKQDKDSDSINTTLCKSVTTSTKDSCINVINSGLFVIENNSKKSAANSNMMKNE